MDPLHTLSLDEVTAALHAAIDNGAWLREEGICGHCYNCGDVYLASRSIFSFRDEFQIAAVCMECLVHRSLWNTYLETSV